MIVLRSTHDALQLKFLSLRHDFDKILRDWNALVERINDRGGEQFLQSSYDERLSQDDIKRLLMLVHPDKHDGKPAAVEMTQKLLRLRQ